VSSANTACAQSFGKFNNKGVTPMPFDPGFSGSTKSGVEEISAPAPTAAQLREFINNEIATADATVNLKKAADEFVRVYKEYGFVDSKENGALIRHELQARGNWPNATITNFEEAFHSLNSSGLLQLDQKKIQANQARLLDARAAEIRESAFDEEKAYAMPMEDLVKRARGW
jgi:hypothetical protein